jgi:malolactic enzyme
MLMADDIQGTGCVTQAAVKSAVWVAKGKVTDQKIIIFGAGTAGTGNLLLIFSDEKVSQISYVI